MAKIGRDFSRFCAVLLSFAMVFTGTPVYAYADMELDIATDGDAAYASSSYIEEEIATKNNSGSIEEEIGGSSYSDKIDYSASEEDIAEADSDDGDDLLGIVSGDQFIYNLRWHSYSFPDGNDRDIWSTSQVEKGKKLKESDKKSFNDLKTYEAGNTNITSNQVFEFWGTKRNTESKEDRFDFNTVFQKDWDVYPILSTKINDGAYETDTVNVIYGQEIVNNTLIGKRDSYSYEYESSDPNIASVDVSTNKITAVGVGTAKITTKIYSFNDTYLGTASYDVKVNKRAVKITAGTGQKLYDGTPLTVSSCVLDPVSANETAGIVSDDQITIEVEGSQTGAGSCDNTIKTVTIKKGDRDVTGCYTIATEKGKLTVNRATLTVTVSQADVVSYDGNPHTISSGDLTITGVSSNDPAASYVTILYSKDKNVWSADPVTFTEVGNHTIYIKVSSPNYEDCFVDTILTIVECPAYFKTNEETGAELKPQPVTATYNGSEIALVTAGTAEGGTVWYSTTNGANLSDTTQWSTAIPKKTNAGTYDVWYYIKGDANHSNSAVYKLTSKINKVASSFANDPLANDSVYDGTAHNLLKTDNIIYKYDDGNYKNNGYVSEFICSNGYRYHSNTSTYTNYTHNTPTATGGTLQYAVTKAGIIPDTANDADWSYSNSLWPKATNAGTYWVWWRVKGDSNHLDYPSTPLTTSSTNKVEVTIDKAKSSYSEGFKVEGCNKIYHATEYNLVTVTGTVNGGALMFSTDYDGISDIGSATWTAATYSGGGWSNLPKTTNAWDGNVYFYIKGDSNHYDLVEKFTDYGHVSSYLHNHSNCSTNGTGEMCGVYATVAKSKLIVKANDVHVTYGDSWEDIFTATVTKADSDQYWDENDVKSLAIKYLKEEGSHVGDYQVRPTFTKQPENYVIGSGYFWEDIFYNEDAFIPGVLTIDPAPLTISADNLEKVYATDDPELTWIATGLKYNEKQEDLVASKTEYKLVVGIEREPGENVGNYVTTVSGDELQGDYQITYKTGTFTITKADVTVTAPTPLDPMYTGEELELVSGGSVDYPEANHTVSDPSLTDVQLMYAVTVSEGDVPADSDYSTESPKKIDVNLDAEGNVIPYYVWYKVVGGPNHNDVAPECVESTIYKDQSEWTLDPAAVEGLIYNNEAFDLITAGTAVHGTPYYYVSDTEVEDISEVDFNEWTTSVPAKTLVNVEDPEDPLSPAVPYYVYYMVKGDKGYKDVDPVEPFEVTIDKDNAPQIGATAAAYVRNYGTEVISKRVTDDVTGKNQLAAWYPDAKFMIIKGSSINAEATKCLEGALSKGTANLSVPETVNFRAGGTTGVMEVSISVAETRNTYGNADVVELTINGQDQPGYDDEGNIVSDNSSAGEEDGELVAYFGEVSNLVLDDDKPYDEDGRPRFVYTGRKIVPSITVMNGSKTLISGVDYTISFKDNKNISKVKKGKMVYATATVKGNKKGKYSGKKVLEFVIVPKDIADEDVLVGSTTVVSNKKATPVITFNGKVLKQGTDYMGVPTDAILQNRTITITGNGNFTGTREVDLTVVTASKPIKVSLPKGIEFQYNGEMHELSAAQLVVTDKGTGKVLTQDEDYTVSYSDNRNAGKVTVMVTGMGQYSGKVKKTFKISPASYAKIKVTNYNELVNQGFAYKKSGVKPVVYLRADLDDDHKDVSLVYGRDYSISYKNNKKVGTATATIKFAKNFDKHAKYKQVFKINPAEFSADTVEVSGTGYRLFKAKKTKAGDYMLKPGSTINAILNGTLLDKKEYTVSFLAEKEGGAFEAITKMTSLAAYWQDGRAGSEAPELDFLEDYRFIKLKAVLTPNNKNAASFAQPKGADPVEYTYYVVDPTSLPEGFTTIDVSKAKISVVLMGQGKKGADKTAKIGYTGKAITFDPDDPKSQGTLKVVIALSKKNKITLYEDGSENLQISDFFHIQYVNNTNKGKAKVILTAKDLDEQGRAHASFEKLGISRPEYFFRGSKSGTFKIGANKLGSKLIGLKQFMLDTDED